MTKCQLNKNCQSKSHFFIHSFIYNGLMIDYAQKWKIQQHFVGGRGDILGKIQQSKYDFNSHGGKL